MPFPFLNRAIEFQAGIEHQLLQLHKLQHAFTLHHPKFFFFGHAFDIEQQVQVLFFGFAIGLVCILVNKITVFSHRLLRRHMSGAANKIDGDRNEEQG